MLLSPAMSKYVLHWGEMRQRWSVNRSVAQLHALPYLADRPLPADRRDHFEAKQDPWDMLVTIVEGRKRREVDPTRVILAECVAEAKADGETPPTAIAKLERLKALNDQLSGWYDEMRHVPRPVLVKLLGLGARVASLVGGR